MDKDPLGDFVSTSVAVENRLTSKEIQIIHYLQRGCRQVEIAYILEVSPSTICRYIKKIRNKCNRLKVLGI